MGSRSVKDLTNALEEAKQYGDIDTTAVKERLAEMQKAIEKAKPILDEAIGDGEFHWVKGLRDAMETANSYPAEIRLTKGDKEELETIIKEMEAADAELDFSMLGGRFGDLRTAIKAAKQYDGIDTAEAEKNVEQAKKCVIQISGATGSAGGGKGSTEINGEWHLQPQLVQGKLAYQKDDFTSLLQWDGKKWMITATLNKDKKDEKKGCNFFTNQAQSKDPPMSNWQSALAKSGWLSTKFQDLGDIQLSYISEERMLDESYWDLGATCIRLHYLLAGKKAPAERAAGKRRSSRRQSNQASQSDRWPARNVGSTAIAQ